MKKNILKIIGLSIILLAINIMVSKTYGYYELTGFVNGFTTPRFGGMETYCAQHGANASYAWNDVDSVADISALSGQVTSYPRTLQVITFILECRL